MRKVLVDLDGFEPSTSSMPWKRHAVSPETLPGSGLENAAKLAGASASLVSRDGGSESDRVLSRESSRARSSVGLEHQPSKLRVAGSSPAAPTKNQQPAGETSHFSTWLEGRDPQPASNSFHLDSTSEPGIAAPQWVAVKDGNLEGRALFGRHYSYRRGRDQMSFFASKERNRNLFVGPGEKMVLLSVCGRALFVWRKFISADGQQGVNCAVFRNEGAGLASDLIRLADELADARWPGERHYTYVNDMAVRHKRDAGRCFLKAGWRYVLDANGRRARTKSKSLLILERTTLFARTGTAEASRSAEKSALTEGAAV